MKKNFKKIGFLWKEGGNMWLLVLLLSIQFQMPTWYWIIVTIIVLIRPFVWIIEKYLEKEIEKSIKKAEENSY